MSMRVEGLVFAGVGSPDHEGVARFLADALGAELEVSGDVQRLLFANGSSLALVPPDYVQPPSDTVLGFLVDDVEAATVELARRGSRAGRRAEHGLRVPVPPLSRPRRAPVRAARADEQPVILLFSLLLGIFVLEEPWSWVVVAGGATLELAETGLFVWWSKRRQTAVGTETLVGRRAVVSVTCRPQGQVRVAGEIWQARCDPAPTSVRRS